MQHFTIFLASTYAGTCILALTQTVLSPTWPPRVTFVYVVELSALERAESMCQSTEMADGEYGSILPSTFYPRCTDIKLFGFV